LIGSGDSGNSWSFGKNLAPEGEDFSNTPGLGDIIESGKNANPIDETGSTAYTIAATVGGNKVELFFGEQVNVLNGEMPPKVGEITDSSLSKGRLVSACQLILLTGIILS
jgi:ankyrin repeat protein